MKCILKDLFLPVDLKEAQMDELWSRHLKPGELILIPSELTASC